LAALSSSRASQEAAAAGNTFTPPKNVWLPGANQSGQVRFSTSSTTRAPPVTKDDCMKRGVSCGGGVDFSE
jgi:hypothetical protein